MIACCCSLAYVNASHPAPLLFEQDSLCNPQVLGIDGDYPGTVQSAGLQTRLWVTQYKGFQRTCNLHMGILLTLPAHWLMWMDVNAKDPNTVTSQHHRPRNACASHILYSCILLMIP